MSQSVFETNQHARDMLAEALAIWEQSNHSEHLEGLGKDPVFSLLMTALAWQNNETDNEIARLKAEVLEEYASMLIPYEAGRATPASVMIQVQPAKGYGEDELDETCEFLLGKEQWHFMPLLHTRVLNVVAKNATRIDGRQWNVDLKLDVPISDLSYMSFAVNNFGFRDLKVRINGKELPLVRPWEFDQLPFTKCFSLDNSLYNAGMSYNPTTKCLDLFAQHNMRMYFVGKCNLKDYFRQESISQLNLVVEFSGVAQDFTFDASQFFVNTNVLVNAQIEQASLDESYPIRRVSRQLLHLIRPSSEQIYGKEQVRVRRVGTDRFNQGSLTKLLSVLIGKIQSDFYAFLELDGVTHKNLEHTLRRYLEELLKTTKKNKNRSIVGTYIMLENHDNVSLTVPYLVTDGSALNASIEAHEVDGMNFSVPGKLDKASLKCITPFMTGLDEVKDDGSATEQIRYVLISNNRIVTPADIRFFCLKELQRRYGVTPSMIHELRVTQQLQSVSLYHHNACGYEIKTTIVIHDTPYIRRTFMGKKTQAEVVLQKMMEVRSANIYPIIVEIAFK